ncbi:MAG: hypothetical protein Hals2KO_21780 [Halioglobus sp.]
MSEEAPSYSAHKVRTGSDNSKPADLDSLPDEVVAQLSREALGPYVAELRRRTIQLQQENTALREALQAVHDDLLIRAEFGSKGEKVVSVGFSVWLQVKAALLQEGEDERE